MHDDLSGRHALVCGASRGIGRATALALAGMGAELSLLARSEDRLLDAVEACRGAGASAVRPLLADLDDLDALDEVLDGLVASHPVHVLVHNTGGPPGGRLLDASTDAILAALRRHVCSAQRLVQKVLPGMEQAGWGRIVTVTSTSVREPIPNLGVSNLTRAAVASWVKTLSRELPSGVTINNVMPGFTETERLASLRQAAAQRTGASVEQVRAGQIAQVPEGRLGRAEEIAAVIAFLCSPAASYVRGVGLPVDGGRLKGI